MTQENQAEKQNPSVERFEQLVAAKNYEPASRELLEILGKLDSNFGTFDGIDCLMPGQLGALYYEMIRHFCTRLANGITALFSDPNFSLSEDGMLRFALYQRWINMIFASSPFVNADHILATYNRNPEPNSLWRDILLDNNINALYKFAVMYLPESNVNVNWDVLWEQAPSVCATLCFALQSPRFIGTQAAFGKRSSILQWFPDKLAQLPNLNKVPANISHDVYMHCSYDVAANKHNVKRALNQVVRRHILENGWQDRDVRTIGYKNGKPVMVVVLEHFHAAHSIYRTHSTSMIAARELFYLVGIGGSTVDEAGRAVFDEFVELPRQSILDNMKVVRDVCERFQSAVL